MKLNLPLFSRRHGAPSGMPPATLCRVAVAAALCLAPALRAQVATNLAPAYRVVDLDVPPAPDAGAPVLEGISDAGQVVGTTWTGTGPLPPQPGFIWDPTNGVRFLPVPAGGGAAQPFGINNHGVVVGTICGPPFGPPFEWDPVNGFRIVDTGPLAGYSSYDAASINDAGALACENWDSTTLGKTYLLTNSTPNGTPTWIATWIGELFPGGRTEPYSLNNSNEIVGYSSPPIIPLSYEAYLWQPGQGITGLGFLPGHTHSVACGINDASQVVGVSENADGTSDAFIWTSAAGMAQLDCSAIGGTNSAANGISAGGIAVGTCQIGGTNHAVAWAPGQDAVDLNSLIVDLSGWVLIQVAGGFGGRVNSSGVMVGYGLRTDGTTHACVLYPVTAPLSFSITSQPASATVAPGGTATFTVGVTGTPPFAYQWQFNGTAISGATNASLTIANFSPTNAGAYQVVVSNLSGSRTSATATLASVDIKLFAGVIVVGPIGANYLIQATSSLPGGWTTLTNIALPSQPYIYIDYGSYTNGMQFYRAVPQP